MTQTAEELSASANSRIGDFDRVAFSDLRFPHAWTCGRDHLIRIGRQDVLDAEIVAWMRASKIPPNVYTIKRQ